MYKEEIRKLRIKKNTIIYTVLFSLITLAVFYFLAHRYNLINKNILDGIYLIVVIVVFVLIMKFKNSLHYIVYKYNYLLMLEENLPPVKTKKAILSDDWQQQFVKDGFTEHINTSKFAIYYQIPKKDSIYRQFGKTLVCIVVNKDLKLDLYGGTIQNQIKGIYEKIEHEYPRLKKEVVIHFKEYERFDDESKKELQKVLNFKQDTFALINISVGYFPKIKKVYYLRPANRYPNKQYFLACNLIKRYI
jgi:hypothetical protein